MSGYGYTHNLHIVLSDNNGTVLSNPAIMGEIYAEIADKDIRRQNVPFMGKTADMCMYWKKIDITPFDQNFIGDLFTTPIHSDAALYEITTNVLWEIEQNIKMRCAAAGEPCNWKIMFHISKFLDQGK